MAKGGKHRRVTAPVVASSPGLAVPNAVSSERSTNARPPVVVQIGAPPRKRRPRGTAHLSNTSSLPLLAESQAGHDWIGALHHRSSVQPDPTTAVSSVTPHVAAEIHSDGVQDGLPVDSQDGLPLDLSFQVVQHIEPDGIRPNRKKKEKQWRTWDTVTIPLLVRPYLRLLRLSHHFREPLPDVIPCGCTVGRTLQVLCVYFNRIENKSLLVCSCSPAALQLLHLGLFACSPVLPTLAVDVTMLEFMRDLFVRLPPNVTAWCGAVEAFLWRRQYRLEYTDSLRQRLGKALQWFTVLVNEADRLVQQEFDKSKDAVLQNPAKFAAGVGEVAQLDNLLPRTPRPSGISGSSSPVLSIGNSSPTGFSSSSISPSSPFALASSPLPSSSPPLPSSPMMPPSEGVSSVPPSPSMPHTAIAANESEQASSTDHSANARRSYPSLYLQEACPICFSPTVFDKMREGGFAAPNVMVMLDGCFTQKRRRTKDGQHDYPRAHPKTCFLSDDFVTEIEEFVEEKRGWKKKDPPSAAVDDKLEEGMKVPNSILESCGVSFKAADERRVKASTKYFADTGLMALVCRHDRTIWLANMTSAGEKQHYALALLFQLLKHLPADATIGVLYDIACQLERSCRKYDYFGADLSRFDFALAVFHAYAHEWACQIIYHPRKCIGYGLTDGEGCERGWRVLQKLIPGLRVSGYHQRKMVLDEQILFNRSQSLTQLASWLVRKWGMAYDKMTKVEGQLRKLRVGDDTLSDEELRAEHAKQVVAQTKPLPRQQKNAGKEAVKQVMQFQRAIEAVGSQIKTLDAKMSAPNDLSNAISGEIMIELNASRAQLVVSLERYELRKLSVMSQLGAVEQEELRQIKMSEYLTCHVNAHALCTRIIHRMRNRRFELDRLERSYRTAVNEAHLEAHITQSMKSRQSTISNLVKRYNTLCDKMQDLIGKKKAPKNAVAPRQIKMEGLFKLDVDHDVWQDLGFGTFDDDDIPLWLSSEKVREGIRHVLELDRCREEVERLGWERCALQEWFMVEWKAIVRAIETTLDENIKFQLEGRQNTLLDLYLGWEGKLKRIHAAYTILDGWGPSWEEEHAREAVLLRSSWKAVSASRNTEEEEVDLEKDDDAYYDGEEGDAGLMQDVETSHEQSAFVEENDEWLQMMVRPLDIDTYFTTQGTPRTPRKRARVY